MRAFEALYERYEVRVFGFVVRMLKNRHDAEEVFHEAILKSLRADRATFAAGGYRAFLYTIARNLVLNRERSSARAERLLGGLPEAERPATPGAALEAKELALALDRAVARLPPSLQEVYELRSSGLSYEEIAGVLAIPLGTLKSRMNQLVKILREEVKPWTAP